MDVVNGETTTGSRQDSNKLSMVKAEFRKGFKVPYLDHQKYGILSRVLWPSKDQMIRIIPGHNPETGEIYPQLINTNKYSVDGDVNPCEYLSNTFTQATIVSRFGNITSPFVSDYAPGSADRDEFVGDTVIHRIIRTIMNATRNKNGKYGNIKAIPQWSQWCGIGPQATLSFDKVSLLMQVLAFRINGRANTDLDTDTEMIDEDGNPVPMLAVIAIDNQVSMQNMYKALIEPMNPMLPLDPATNSKYGSLAELNSNILYLNSYNDPTSHHMALRPSLQPAGKGWNPEPYPMTAEQAKALWHPWVDLLHFMTAREQVELCARELGADTVNYIIGQDPQFRKLIPDNIAAAGFGRYANAGSQVTLSSGTGGSAAPAFNPVGLIAPSKALGPLQAAQSAPQPQPTQSVAAPKPLAGLQPNATIDPQAILARTEEVRRAAGMKPIQPPVDQAAEAQDLLGNDVTPGQLPF